jgi:hypothetical protein
MFKSKLIVEVPLIDNGYRTLQQDLIYETPFRSFIIPKGFKTDYASVPKVFWNILPPTGVYTYAAVLHDYLYHTGIVSKEDADKLFYDVMLELGVSKVKAYGMYKAVDMFGFKAWNDHKKRRDNENRNSFHSGIGI